MASRAGTAQTPLQTPLDRRLFPITSSWVYCNHAAVGPLPQPTRDAVGRALDAQMYEGSAGILSVEADLEAIRSQTAAALNASIDEVAFLRSTSDGALLAANGLRWREGDEIIVTDNEFGANAYPWLNLRDLGVHIRLVRAPGQRITVETLEAMQTPRTRLVAVSYVTFSDGYRHDLAALGRFCRDAGILFAVDAMQGFGYLPLDVSHWCIDFCYFGAAKWLLSPQGLSIVYVRRELVDGLRPAFASWRSVREPMVFLDYGQELAEGARRFEGGTVNYSALIGFAESLRILSSAGFQAIERHVLALCERLIQGAHERGIEVRSDLRPGARSGIVLLGLGERSVEDLNERALHMKIGLTIRDNGIRVSPHGYNTTTEIDAVLDMLGR